MYALGTISYGAAAVAFAILASLLVLSWRGRRTGPVLAATCIITSTWATLLAFKSSPTDDIQVVALFEAFRVGAWLFSLSVLARLPSPRWLIVSARVIAALLMVSVIVAVAALGALGIDPFLVMSRFGMVATVISLVLLEQIYRSANDESRSALRYFTLALGGLFVYDLFLYSQVELSRGITADAWIARGFLHALAVPVIAFAARRVPQWSVDLFVSRQVVFYAASLAALGLYVILVLIGGFYVRRLGGEWGELGRILFFAGMAVILMLAISSVSLRRHARVFISKHFYRNKYDYRVEWLRFIRTLSEDDTNSSGDPQVKQVALRAIAQIFSIPTGILFTFDETTNRFVPSAAWPTSESLEGLPELPLDDGLPRFLAETQWVIDLKEFRESPHLYGRVDLPSWILNRADLRLISPLLQPGGLHGFVILGSPPSPFELTYEDRDLLKTVGRHVATHLARHEASSRLAENRQFEAFNRLTAFMMHDLKNSIAQLQLIVANAERHKRNEKFVDDAIATIANTAERMRRLMEQIKGAPVASRNQPVEIGSIAREASLRCGDRLPLPQVELLADATVCADAERLTSVVEHLIRNAQDACSDTGTIVVRVDQKGAHAVLEVSDSGVGMEAAFIRERLFRPFDSTKGSKGLGIGAYQAREYARSIGGQLEVQSSPGEGTRFCIKLPLITSNASARLAAEAH
jgi:putative PEP-CTERM system histidine kinase